MYQAAYGEGPEKAERRKSRLRGLVVDNFRLRSLWHALAGQWLCPFLRKARGKVLDVGCGTGDLLEEAAARGCEAYGLEFNPESVARCKERGLKATCGDLESASLPEASFDTIVFWHSLEHLPSPKRALEKAARLLKPGGRVYVYLPNAGCYLAAWAGPAWFPWHLPFHFYHFTPATLRRLSEASGLRVVSLRTATADFCVSRTLRALSAEKPRGVARFLADRLSSSLAARLLMLPVLRALDFLMPGRGEFIFLELAKG